MTAIKTWPSILSCFTAEKADALIAMVKARMFESPEKAAVKATPELLSQQRKPEAASMSIKAPEFRGTKHGKKKEGVWCAPACCC